MRTATTGELTVLGLDNRATAWRVQIQQGSTWYDLSDLEGMDWCKSASVSDSVDANTKTAKVDLFLDSDWLTLNPYVQGSKVNNYTGTFDALIQLGRDIKIDVAVGITEGGTPSDWKNLFTGNVADFSVSGQSISINCVDQAYDLINTYIETERLYGSNSSPVAAESIMQDILDDNGYSSVTLYTPSSPGFAIREYVLRKQPILSALRQIAEQIGWLVKYRWDNTTSAWRLTFYEPDRSASSVAHTFGPDEYYDPRGLALDGKSIRNVIGIVWWDGDDRTLSTFVDSTSVTQYGRRYMEIIEEQTSQLNSSTEVATLGNALKADLANPSAQAQITVDLFWPVQVGDYYGFTANGKFFDQDQELGVVSYTHQLDSNGATTKLSVRGKPSGGFSRWLRKEARGDYVVDLTGGIPGQGAADMVGPDNNSTNAWSAYTQKSGGGLGSFHLSSASQKTGAVVPNFDFGEASRDLDLFPPDGWEGVRDQRCVGVQRGMVLQHHVAVGGARANADDADERRHRARDPIQAVRRRGGPGLQRQPDRQVQRHCRHQYRDPVR
jgi:hypothetical protein